MRPGEPVECAIWLSGTETAEQIERWKTQDCADIARRTEEVYGVRLGPWKFETKRPGEDRVPPVPDHINGPDVQLLVGVALVAYGKPRIEHETGFVADLDKDDLKKLRALTRRARAKAGHPPLTNRQCDQIIEALGPKVALKELRRSVN